VSLELTALLAWTLMYGFAATLYLVAFTRRRVEPELSRFGFVCVAFAIISYSRARFIMVTSTEDLLQAAELGAAGRYLLGAAFVAFGSSLARAPSQLVPLVGLWAAIGIVLVVTGLHGALGDDGVFRVRPLGLGMLVVGLVLAAAVLVHAARRRGYDVHVRRIVVAASICVIAGAADVVVAALGFTRLDLLAHSGIVGVVVVHWTLLDRFGEATQTLESRRAAYVESLDDLTKKHEELVETEQLAVVGELSAVIAHEVRNPLAVIKNAASAIRRGVHGEDARRKLVDILDEETERLHKLTFELGAFAELGKPNATTCHLPAVLDHCVNRARAHQRSEGGAEVKFETRAEAETVVADPELLESALFSLVQNAMDASHDGATVRLETFEADLDGEPAVELRVSDEGEGMDATTLEKCTTPFFTTRSRGTGLALALVQRIATNHGGRLMLESQKGVGTVARLVLPRVRPSLLPSVVGLTSPSVVDARGGSPAA
jgi:signal transduction histidine kinase